MKNRMVNTSFWDDGYIVSLDPVEKLLFLYLLTNPLTNVAGIYEITLRRVAFDTGIDESAIKNILKRFTENGKAAYHDGWMYIPNFIKHQSINPKIQTGIEMAFDRVPKEVLDGFGIGKDRLSKAWSYSNSNLNPNSNSKVGNKKKSGDKVGDKSGDFSSVGEVLKKHYP